MTFAVLFGSACTVAQALIPAAVGRGIDQGLIGQDRRALLVWSGCVLLLGLIQAVTGTLRDRCALTNRLGATYRTVRMLTAKVADLGAELPRSISAGSLVTISTTDLGRIGLALESMARGGGAVVSIVLIAVLMLVASWQLGGVVLLGVPLVAWVVARLMRRLHQRQNDLRERQGALTDLAVDIVDGLQVMRGVGGERVFAARYAARSQRVRSEGVRLATVEAWIAGCRLLFPGFLTTAIVGLGIHQVRAGVLSPGALVAFYGYAVFLAEQMRRLTTTVDRLTRALAGAQRIVGVLSAVRQTGSGTRTMPDHRDEFFLADPVSGLTVPAGSHTAIVCARASEADALADRLGHYADPPGGYAGVPLDEFPVDEVRRRILLVDRDPKLFSGVLADQLGCAADPDEVGRALWAASAQDVIDALPDGLKQEIGGGREFSGGQRQRLALARALAADPETLILLDPTSAQDAHTEARIADRVRAHRAGRRTVVLTTSPILLDRADHVIFVENGRVTAEGTHRELLGSPSYRPVVSRGVNL
ncbi:ABC transporter ATP-binding protein [Actinomadura meridiana]